jgi:hypothetical protein
MRTHASGYWLRRSINRRPAADRCQRSWFPSGWDTWIRQIQPVCMNAAFRISAASVRRSGSCPGNRGLQNVAMYSGEIWWRILSMTSAVATARATGNRSRACRSRRNGRREHVSCRWPFHSSMTIKASSRPSSREFDDPRPGGGLKALPAGLLQLPYPGDFQPIRTDSKSGLFQEGADSRTPVQRLQRTTTWARS